MLSVDTLITDNRSGLDSSVRSTEEVGPALAEFRDLLASLRLITRQRGTADRISARPRAGQEFTR